MGSFMISRRLYINQFIISLNSEGKTLKAGYDVARIRTEIVNYAAHGCAAYRKARS